MQFGVPASRWAYLWAKRMQETIRVCPPPRLNYAPVVVALLHWKRQEDRKNKNYGLELQRHKMAIIRVLWNASTYHYIKQKSNSGAPLAKMQSRTVRRCPVAMAGA